MNRFLMCRMVIIRPIPNEEKINYKPAYSPFFVFLANVQRQFYEIIRNTKESLWHYTVVCMNFSFKMFDKSLDYLNPYSKRFKNNSILTLGTNLQTTEMWHRRKNR